jgi:carbonic anhydrase
MKASVRSWTYLASLVLGLVLIAGGPARAAEEAASGPSGDEALKKLLDGNRRFYSEQYAKRSVGPARRMELLKGQHPFAIVLCCSDSRVAPEILFDQGLGDLFIVRVAGNTADSVALGSIEYAAEHLHAPLLFVLGHEKCGAVAATAQGGEAPGNIASIVSRIAPAVEKARAAGKTGDALVSAAVDENVSLVLAEVVRRSAILANLVHEGKLVLAGGKYALGTGRVELMGAGGKKRRSRSPAEGH